MLRRKFFSRKAAVFFLLLSITISFWLYRDSFDAYFFQDDWFSLRISNAKSIKEFLSFFIPRTDVIYYRPLGMQIPFFVLRSIFGVNPFPFRVLTFLTHAVNIILVFILIRLLTKNDNIALLSSYLYGTSVVHYTIFFWSSIYSFIAGPTAFFLSFILLLLFLRKRNKNYYFLSLVVFTLGFLTNEMVAVLPIILFLYLLFLRKRIRFSFLLPYLFFVVSLFALRFILFPPPSSGFYQLGIGKHVLNNLEAYFLWSFNWPEETKAQLINFYVVNSQFIKDFPWYFFVFILTLLVNVFLFYLIPLKIISHEKKKEIIRLIFFSLSWFVFGLITVIFFPFHTFSYYLPISLVGLLLASTSIFDYLINVIYRFNRWISYILVFAISVNWLVISVITFEFNSKVHWAPRRAVLSKVLVDKAKQFYSPPLSGIYVIYVRPSSENKLSLNDQDALKIVFNNEDIVTLYTNRIKGKEIL